MTGRFHDTVERDEALDPTPGFAHMVDAFGRVRLVPLGAVGTVLARDVATRRPRLAADTVVATIH